MASNLLAMAYYRVIVSYFFWAQIFPRILYHPLTFVDFFVALPSSAPGHVQFKHERKWFHKQRIYRRPGWETAPFLSDGEVMIQM